MQQALAGSWAMFMRWTCGAGSLGGASLALGGFLWQTQRTVWVNDLALKKARCALAKIYTMFIPYLSDNHQDKLGIALIGSDQVLDIPNAISYLWPMPASADQVGDILKTKRINLWGANIYSVNPWHNLRIRKISLVYLEALVCTRDIPCICQNTKTYQQGQDSTWREGYPWM